MESIDPSFESEITRQTYEISRQTPAKPRAKTSQRLKYEEETRVFKQELGGLEDIRKKLGFSRRKICQILKVDPSAWTRWTQEGADAPPHIYQSIKWYMDSKGHEFVQIEKHLNDLRTENFFLQKDLRAMNTQISRFKTYFYATFGAFLFGSLVIGWLVLGRGP